MNLIRTFRNNLKIALPVTAVVLAALAWLAFGFFGIHTLFIDNEVNEAGPVFDSGAGGVAAGVEVVTDEVMAEMDDVMEEENVPAVVEASDGDAMPEAPEILTIFSGDFVPHAHPAEGQAIVLTDGTAQRFLRFENFATDNGPDLNVYLSNSSADAGNGTFDDDFIDLGDLKGNIGPQNYEIPEDVDLSVYDTVVIWCVRFGVSFGAADLIAT